RMSASIRSSARAATTRRRPACRASALVLPAIRSTSPPSMRCAIVASGAPFISARRPRAKRASKRWSWSPGSCFMRCTPCSSTGNPTTPHDSSSRRRRLGLDLSWDTSVGDGWRESRPYGRTGQPIAQSWIVPSRNRATYKRRPVVEKDTINVALDDSKRKLAVALLRPGATEPEEREIPKDPLYIQRLFRRLRREGPVQACCEAGVSGYDLHRQITACDVACQVIAPALTPPPPRPRLKTDLRDAQNLVRLSREGELAAIHVPDEAEEAARDLVRCREAVRRDVVRWRHRLLKLLDRHGRLWVAEKNWTQRHWSWIRAQHFEQS